MSTTVIEALEATARSHGSAPALRVKRGGAWQTTTWRQYRDEVFAAAAGLARLGLGAGGGVAVMGYNRPEWFVADLGAIAAGGVPTGIYTTVSVLRSTSTAGAHEPAGWLLEGGAIYGRIEEEPAWGSPRSRRVVGGGSRVA
jgi:long-subunit acyl-CoA synthetase (AMP-forming)